MALPIPIPSQQLTAEEAFGAQSVLVPMGEPAWRLDPEVLGGAFQGVVICITIVYIFFILRYWNFVRYFILSSVGFKTSKRMQAHINPGEQYNLEVVMIVVGVLFTALAVVRGCGLWRPEAFDGIEPSDTVWIVGGVVVAVLALLMAAEYLVLKAAGAVSERAVACHELLHLKLLHLSVGFAAIMPAGVMFLLGSDSAAEVCFWIMVAECIISLIIFVKETFLFFVAQKMSLLHWILYLCALEILPVSLMLAPLLRADVGI